MPETERSESSHKYKQRETKGDVNEQKMTERQMTRERENERPRVMEEMRKRWREEEQPGKCRQHILRIDISSDSGKRVANAAWNASHNSLALALLCELPKGVAVFAV